MNLNVKRQNLVDYIQVTFASILLLFLIRIAELAIINYYGIYGTSFKNFVRYSINFDSYFVISTSIILLFPYLYFSKKYPKRAITIYKIIWVFLIVIFSLLTHFFISAEYLLSSIVFQFSWKEVWHIISIERGNSRIFIWLLHLSIPLSIVIYFLVLKHGNRSRRIENTLMGVFVAAILLVLGNYGHFYKPSHKFDSQFDFFIGNNKVIHFVKSIIQSRKHQSEFSPEQLSLAIENVQQGFQSFEFKSKEYPLIHTGDYDNVLGGFFKKSDKPPNLVFIISESLGGGFSGLHPTADHLLPYIDTLAMNGLYWEDFLSNCCRTYGVLSNVFASLVPGTVERGFPNYNGEKFFGKRYPDHNSLVKELKKNGYFTSFFYGGWGAFDNYEFFIKDQKIDLYMDQDHFDSTKYLAPWERRPKAHYWGYDDRALLNQFFDYEAKNGVVEQPYLSIYLTLNMHEPYNISPEEYYEDEFIRDRLRKLNLRKDSPFLKKDNQTLGSLFFYEDTLREFMNRYRQREDYDNTIFLIFGDHYSLESFLGNPLGIYHVPFIIYSSLIQKSQTFKGVSTHQDIAPSLIALLQGNFNLKFEQKKHWLGQGLDTSTVFRCDRIAPFNLYSTDFPHFLYKNYFLTENGTVLKIKKDLQTEIVKDERIINEVNQFSEDFKMVDKYVCDQNKIWKN